MGLRILAIFVLATMVAACSTAREGTTVRVFAASSLTDVVQTLGQRFTGVHIDTSFGGSGALARQVRDGAPADVFLSASAEWIDFLRDNDRLDGEPIVFAGNRLVCVASKRGSLTDGRVAGPRALLEAIGSTGRVAIADEGVPAGEYARSALEHADLLAAFRPRLVGQRDVRAVLHAVELGEVDAGFVYATDARDADVDVVFVFDPASHPPIVYEAAVLRGSAEAAEARRFLDYLRGESARTLLADAGFSLPEAP